MILPGVAFDMKDTDYIPSQSIYDSDLHETFQNVLNQIDQNHQSFSTSSLDTQQVNDGLEVTEEYSVVDDPDTETEA